MFPRAVAQMFQAIPPADLITVLTEALLVIAPKEALIMTVIRVMPLQGSLARFLVMMTMLTVTPRWPGVRNRSLRFMLSPKTMQKGQQISWMIAGLLT